MKNIIRNVINAVPDLTGDQERALREILRIEVKRLRSKKKDKLGVPKEIDCPKATKYKGYA